MTTFLVTIDTPTEAVDQSVTLRGYGPSSFPITLTELAADASDHVGSMVTEADISSVTARTMTTADIEAFADVRPVVIYLASGDGAVGPLSIGGWSPVV